MKRILFAAFLLVGTASAQWTEGGARIGEHLDTLAVTFQGMGTLFNLQTFNDAADMYVTDTLGNVRFSVWGYGYGGGGQLNLYNASGTRTIILRGDGMGDGSVILPQDAIHSSEIFNEAGVASARSNSSVTLTGSFAYDTILVQTIVAPDSGYLLILGSGQVTLSHINGSSSLANFGLMVDGTIPNTQDVALSVGPAAPTTSYRFPITVQMIYPVGPGSHDVAFWGQQTSTSGTFTVFDMQLSVVYLPTAYGTVAKASTTNMPDDQAPVRTSTPSIQQIRSKSEAANQARIQAELARIRAQLKQLEDELRRTQK